MVTNSEGHVDGGAKREPPDSSAQSKSPRTLRNFMHGNRETSGASASETATDRREKASSHTARMHAPEESDRGVVCAEQRVDREG
jgi:hypothetical protein